MDLSETALNARLMAGLFRAVPGHAPGRGLNAGRFPAPWTLMGLEVTPPSLEVTLLGRRSRLFRTSRTGLFPQAKWRKIPGER